MIFINELPCQSICTFEYALWIVIYDCRRCGRSGKFQVSLYIVNEKLSYDEIDEMHRELINLHPGVSAPAQG